MSTDRQRDADLDRLLRATLRRDTAASVGACPDAGMLAALVEGGASAEERTTLESHIATCGRCQDTLAAMAVDVPASLAAAHVTPARRSWLWRGHLHWLIPVTAASVLVVYLASKSAIAPSFPPTTPDSTQVAAVPSDAPAQLPQKDEQPGFAPTPAVGSASNVTTRADRSPKAAKPAVEPVAAPPLPAAPAPPPPTPPAPPLTTEAVQRMVVAPSAPATPVPPLPSEAVQRMVVAPSAPAAPAGGGVAGASAAKIAAADRAPREAQAPMALREQALQAPPPSVVEVAAGGGFVAWRVGPGGAIWRSADEGRTWYPQKSGVTATLLAAAAPTMTTCWVVGAAGTVLLTDDGERWERRPFPGTIDLVAVESRSSREATVTTRDGRRFTTTDRGTTWIIRRD